VPLLGAEDAVARIAEPRDDLAVLVERDGRGSREPPFADDGLWPE
jgi:hypothetical protein